MNQEFPMALSSVHQQKNDTQILEYWNNILGKDVIELIDKAYGLNPNR